MLITPLTGFSFTFREISPVFVQAKKLESLMKKQQLVYAMLDTTLDLELLTDALRAVLQANGAPCSLFGGLLAR